MLCWSGAFICSPGMLVWTGCWLCECLGNCSFYAIDFSPLNFLSTYIPGKILCDLSWHPARHTKRFAACRLLMEINRQRVWRNHAFGKNQGQFTQRNFHLMSCSCWVIWLAVLAIWQGHPQAQYCGSSPCYGTYVLPEFFLLPFRWQLMLIFDLEVDLLRCLFVCLFLFFVTAVQACISLITTDLQILCCPFSSFSYHPWQVRARELS